MCNFLSWKDFPWHVPWQEITPGIRDEDIFSEDYGMSSIDSLSQSKLTSQVSYMNTTDQFITATSATDSAIETTIRFNERDDYNTANIPSHHELDRKVLECLLSESWTWQDLANLIDRLRRHCKKVIGNNHKTVSSKVNWDKIAVKKHTAIDCKRKWLDIKEHLRSFRTFTEVMRDAELFVKTCKDQEQCRRPKSPAEEPFSAYMLYCKDMRSILTKQFPNHKPSDLYAMFRIEYESLSQKEKRKYESRAVKLKKDEEIQHSLRISSRTPRTSNARNDKVVYPEKAKSALEHFFEAQIKKRPLLEGETKKSRLDTVKQKYKVISDNRKVKYIRRAQEDKERYLREVESLGDKHGISLTKKVKYLISKEERLLLESSILQKDGPRDQVKKISQLNDQDKETLRSLLSRRPKAPPNDPFDLYVDRHHKTSTAIEDKQLLELANSWKMKTEEEKWFKFGIKLEKMKEKYIKSLNAFENSLKPREQSLADQFLQDRRHRIKAAKKLKLEYEEPEEEEDDESGVDEGNYESSAVPPTTDDDRESDDPDYKMTRSRGNRFRRNY